MLNHIINTTNRYLEKIPKSERKKIGQFFTSKNAASFMAGMFKDNLNGSLNILDPGGGTGILSGALVERLQVFDLDSIHILIYENDENVLPVLESNCSYLRESSEIPLTIDLVRKKFILDNDFNRLSKDSKARFDMVVSNPPYRKISKRAPESQRMLEVVHGSPNLYSLFMALSLDLLKENGEMVFIIPRSWTAGKYFKEFRKYLLANGSIINIHLFERRTNLFKKDATLQETMIVKVAKTRNPPEFVNISSSSDFLFDDLNVFNLPYEKISSFDDDSYVFLPVNQREAYALTLLNRFKHKLADLGLRLKTGLTVGFKNRELLKESNSPGSVPIFYPCHFNEGLVKFPASTDKKQFISNDKAGLLQDNRNWLFLKRVTSKEEKRRLQPAIYLQDSLNEFSHISTDNKINFIDTAGADDSLALSEIYGLFVLFNSTLYDCITGF